MFLVRQYRFLLLSRAFSTITVGNEITSTINFFNPRLRDYQKDCIKTCLELLQKGVKRQVVSLPVGSGKTVVFSELIKHVPEPIDGANKVLVLAHRQELLSQARNQILRKVGIEQGSQSASEDCEVIVASVPTLGRANSDRLNLYDPKKFKCIVIDEAHHSVASTYLRIVDHFGLLQENNHIFLLGCSATVHRTDNLGLGKLYQKIAYHVDIRTMLAEKWLCHAEFYTVSTNVNIDSAWKKGRLDSRQLSIVINTKERNKLVAETWMNNAVNTHSCKSTLVFAIDVAHIHGLKEAFKDIGVVVESVDGTTKPKVRAQILDDFRSGKFPVLINCGVLTEGTDIPNIDCLVMARPTNSKNLYIQMVGRGLRLHEGKEKCLILDFCDHASKNVNLVSFPSLSSKEKPKKKRESAGNVTGALDTEEGEENENEEENPVTVIPDIDSKAVKINLKRQDPFGMGITLNDHVLDWIKVTPSMFFLSIGEKDFLLMVAVGGDAKIGTLFKVVRWSFDSEVKEPVNITKDPISTHEILDFVHNYLEQNKGSFFIANKTSFWKTREMSTSQFNLLKDIAKNCNPDMEEADVKKLIGYRWNRGTVGRIISKYKFLKKMRRKFTWEELMDGIDIKICYRSQSTVQQPQKEQPEQEKKLEQDQNTKKENSALPDSL